MVDIKPFTSEYDEYRKDESRSVGEFASISFPTSEAQVCEVLAHLAATQPGEPVTVQGGRTGLAAGAVPHGGHLLNLTKMTRVLGARQGADGTFYLRVEPGVVLSQLRKDLEDKNIATVGWDDASLQALEALYAGPEQFFPTDPTETSATIGGMVACNASGARSYLYGPVRPHVEALRVALANGDLLDLRRGETRARDLELELVTAGGSRIAVDLPTYRMPNTKNASGYYVEPNMDAVDLFVGSDGTLGVITQIELRLTPVPATVWGVSCFFANEPQALSFTEAARAQLARAGAFEFFDAGALNILRAQKAQSTAFAGLPAVPADADCCIYVELDCASDDEALEQLYLLGSILEQCGGSEQNTWVARTAIDREQQRFFRHAVPESVNMLIDERKKADPAITKLGSDMSVPNEHLRDVVSLYRRTLAEEGLQTATWGHIGNNHLHVNVLPRNAQEYARGKELYARWAAEVTRMGGAVSAEHGVGKLKRGFLEIMYGERHIREMAAMKRQVDPLNVLGLGNLFDANTPLSSADNPSKEA